MNKRTLRHVLWIVGNNLWKISNILWTVRKKKLTFFVLFFIVVLYAILFFILFSSFFCAYSICKLILIDMFYFFCFNPLFCSLCYFVLYLFSSFLCGYSICKLILIRLSYENVNCFTFFPLVAWGLEPRVSHNIIGTLAG